MFNRGPNPDAVSVPKPPTGPAMSVPQQQPQPGPAPAHNPFAPATTMGTSVIGTDLTIIGEKLTIISQNRLQIDGDIRGDVNGRQIVIGEDGSVHGTVSAESIEVRGGVTGAIHAQSVTLTPTAVVAGDIVHQTLAIAEGAQFDGRVRRTREGEQLKPQLDPAAFGAAHDGSQLGGNGASS